MCFNNTNPNTSSDLLAVLVSRRPNSADKPTTMSLKNPCIASFKHSRTIGKARLGSARTPIKEHFQSEEVGQYAFGAERGGEMLIIAQNAHQDLHPDDDDVLASEDGISAYNNVKKDKIALGLLESDYEEIRGLHRYFLRAHKRPTNIYVAGHRTPSGDDQRQERSQARRTIRSCRV